MFAFSNEKNNERKITNIEIFFEGEDNLFITHETVSKLLIQNQGTVKNKPKETLDLNLLESALNSNPMIKSAQVFVSVDGDLTAEIKQKKPIARVRSSESFYIDEEGGYMPLSTNYTARVPIVTGKVTKDNLKTVFKMAQKITNDDFLLKHVTQIHQNDDNRISLRLRQVGFEVFVGDLNNLDRKINNLKAFYKKATKDKILNNYSKVNLQFDSQVVCTKS
ncbi:cell division protein FtsQ/DivIB [Hanstruepera flava]|uniref:cell division protein FtsQ/DivIB n=1 Tax=Hanstruepera flava TaxID=2930218 RepID=UPI00293ECB55|nr:cell division protein FtsQ/DivIB [Hanstruepera flava]